MSKLRHGQLSYYTNRHCRCPECRAAFALYNRQRRARRAALIAGDPGLATHGRVSTYQNWGCRCDACRSAVSKARVG